MSNERQLEAPLPELDIFGLPHVQKSVTGILDTVHNPTSYSRSWNSSSTIEFVIDLADDEYMLMHETSMYLAFEITKKGTGTWSPADETDTKLVTPVNNIFHSAIDRVQVKIGSSGHLIDITDYGYKAYLSTLLGYNQMAKDTHLKCAGWEEDEDARRKMFIKELTPAKFHLRGKLFYDFEHQCRAIVGGSRVDIKINLKPSRFILNVKEGKSTHSTELDDVRLYVKRYKVAEGKVKAHQKALNTINARYPMSTYEIKTMAIRMGSTVVSCDNLVTGKMPTRMFVVMVSKPAYTGSFGHDPFEFKHYNLESIACLIDGVQSPNRPYRADIENNDVVDIYYHLFEALNQHDADTVCGIDFDDFLKNAFVIGFNFTPDMSNGYSLDGHCNLIRQGHLRLDIRYAKALSEDIHLLAFCEFDTLYEIDQFKNLILKK